MLTTTPSSSGQDNRDAQVERSMTWDSPVLQFAKTPGQIAQNFRNPKKLLAASPRSLALGPIGLWRRGAYVG